MSRGLSPRLPFWAIRYAISEIASMIPLFTSSIAEFPVPVEGEGLFFRYFKKIFSKYSLLMVPCFFPALIKSLIDCIIPPYPEVL